MNPAGDDHPVGSAAEEAAKLLGVLGDWARDHGSDLGTTVEALTDQVTAAAHDVDAHLATGEDCRYCPLCRAVQVYRSASPEVREHLGTAVGSLAQAATVFLSTPPPEGRRPGWSASTSPTTGQTSGPRTARDLTVGVDVGGTKIVGGVVDEEGKILEELRVVSPATDVAAIEDAITQLVVELAGRHDVHTLGVGAAAYIDTDPSLDVRGRPGVARPRPASRARGTARSPVAVENAANAAAWGESRSAQARMSTTCCW